MNRDVKWGPSIHIFGYKYDHGMVQLTWKFRVKVKILHEPPIDLSRLKDPVIKHDYDAAVITEIAEASMDVMQPTLYEDYLILCTLVAQALQDTVPEAKKQKGKVRERSAETMQLFDDRIRDFENLEKGSAEWHEVRLRYRNAITHSCRQDYCSFVDGVLEEMKVAASKGDSRCRSW